MQDVGKSILESYSRVLESLAFNIVARIDDLLYVDDLTRQSDNIPSTVDVTAYKRMQTPCIASSKSAFTTPKFSPGPMVSVDRSPLLNKKPPRRGFGVKRALTNYLANEMKGKSHNGQLLVGPPCIKMNQKENRNPSMSWT